MVTTVRLSFMCINGCRGSMGLVKQKCSSKNRNTSSFSRVLLICNVMLSSLTKVWFTVILGRKVRLFEIKSCLQKVILIHI